ncbi:MAG: hypothetical protein GY866_08020 [Proteobacteria bacterium]|nr:hypothetical protein [Pseudomonadota bacterium]
MRTKNTPKQAFLTWLYQTPTVSKPTFKGLNLTLFLIEKIPGLRDWIPITDPRKNNMTYLPINRNIADEFPKTLPVDQAVGEVVNEILPPQILDDMIDKCSFHLVMDECICRIGYKCENFSSDIGCLFMGETAKKLPPGLGHRVSKEEAHGHLEKAVAAGLVPMIGKVNVDNLGFLTPDTRELLSVCFCCHCCCMMGYYKHSPEHLKKLFKPVAGLKVEVTDKCRGCGSCVETCVFDAISIQGGVAAHADHCVGCGRCQRTCPNEAVQISMNNPNYIEDVKQRIESFVNIS